jgi:YidC/Oxa1 family membrane protein insertase
MQDQGRRLIIACAVAMAFLLVWQNFVAKKPADEPKPTPGSAAVSAPKPKSQVGVGDTPPTAPAATTQPTAAAPPATPTPVVEIPRGPEQLISLSYPTFNVSFSSYGGIIKAWHLNDPRYVNDATRGELLPSVPDSGAFAVNFASSTYVLPKKAEWTGVKVSDTEVTYTLATDQLEVVKDFVLVPDSYIVKLRIKVSVKTPGDGVAHETLAITSYGFQDPEHTGGGSSRVQARVWESSTLRDGELYSTGVKSLLEYPRYEPKLTWTGFEHPYLLVAIAPNPSAGSVEKHTYAQPSGLMQTDLLFTSQQLKHGDPALVREVVGYLGPKNLDALTGADTAVGFSTGYSQVIDLGWFGFIGKRLLWLLLRFYSVVGNWGIAIVLLTLLVKGLTIPFTTKSMRSMKAMAALGPQMKDLQAKYKEDRQRLQVETMALYKQHGVNPLSGCLPIFLQMPIWLALYRMLSSAGELYLQPFIPGWINDLTSPDPSYILSVVLLVTMFAQARLTPQTTDPSQRMQQRFLQYGMPLMFGVMSVWFPSGLTLYIFTNTILSALHSLYMNKFDKKSLAIAELIKQNKAAADAKLDPKAVKNAKDANPKPNKDAVSSSAKALPATIDTDDDTDTDDAEPSLATSNQRNPRVQPGRQKRKKGRRR